MNSVFCFMDPDVGNTNTGAFFEAVKSVKSEETSAPLRNAPYRKDFDGVRLGVVLQEGGADRPLLAGYLLGSVQNSVLLKAGNHSVQAEAAHHGGLRVLHTLVAFLLPALLRCGEKVLVGKNQCFQEKQLTPYCR